MKAVVLAGGRGTRGRPFTDYIPKAMIPVHGKPLISHIVRHLNRSSEIGEIIIVADFDGLGMQIEKYFDGSKEAKKPMRFIQDSQSGTGGDLVHLQKHVGKDPEFLLWFVDNLTPLDIRGMHRFHLQKKTLATIATRRYRKEETGYAVVEDGVIAEFREKPTIRMEMAECLGIYILDSKILKIIRSKKGRKDVNLSYDILQPLSKEGKIAAYDIGRQPWIDVDSPGRVEREKEVVAEIIRKI